MSIIMTSITWVSPRYENELVTILGLRPSKPHSGAVGCKPSENHTSKSIHDSGFENIMDLAMNIDKLKINLANLEREVMDL